MVTAEGSGRPADAPRRPETDTAPQRVSERAIREHVLRFHEEYDAVIVWERDGGIVHWSPGAERLYGWTTDEASSRPAHELLATRSLPSNIHADLAAGF